MSDLRTEDLTQILTRVLREQRARIRGRFLLHGLGWMLAAAAAATAVYFLLDRWLHLPTPVRLVITGAIVVYLAFGWRRRIAYPLRRDFTHDDTALAIERRFPEVRERLISAIQLGDQAARAGENAGALRGQSAAMISKLVADAAAAIPSLPFEELLDPRRTRRVYGIALVAVLAILVQAIPSPRSLWIFAQRALGSDAAYPRETTIHLELDEADKDLKIRSEGRRLHVTMATGGDLAVVVRSEGRAPREAQLVVSGGRGTAPLVAMTARGQGRFRHVFRRVSGPMTFHARAGDDDRGDREVVVEVVRPPAVAGIRATIKPPAYTRRDATTVATGSLEAFEGSTVVLDVLPLPAGEDGLGAARACKLVFLESAKTIELTPVTVQDDGGARAGFRGEFVVERSDRYEVHLIGDQDLAAPHPSAYSLVATPDYPPVGNVLLPADDNFNVVLARGVVPIRIEARDDHGIAAANAIVTIGKAQTEVPVALLAVGNDAPPVREAWPTALLDLAGPATASRKGLAQLGDAIAVTVNLRDGKPPEGATSKLAGRTLHVVGETDFARRVATHFRTIRDDVESALQQQSDRLERTKETLEDESQGKARTVPLQATLVALTSGQSRAQAMLDRIAFEFMRSFCLHLFNRIDESQHAARALELWTSWHVENGKGLVYDPAFFAMLAAERKSGRLGAMEKVLDPILEMQVRTQGLASTEAPAALRALTEAGVADTTTARLASLTQAVARQAEIVAGLKALLARLDEWNEFQDVVTQTRSVRDKQREIRERTKSLNQGKGR